MDKEVEKYIKAMQTSLYDQISGLKTDTQTVAEDTQAALEICAELERNVNVNASDKERIKQLSNIVQKIVEISAQEAKDNELSFIRIRILSGINYMYSRLSILNLIKLRLCSDDPKEMYLCIQPMFKLMELRDSVRDKLDSARSVQEIKDISDEFSENFMAIQKEIENQNIQLIDGTNVIGGTKE
jgi:hypothetical protein